MKPHAKPLPTDRERLTKSLTILELHRRDVILEAIAKSAKELMHASDATVSFQKVLEYIGQATDVDRVHMIAIDPAGPFDEGRIIDHRRWTAPGISTPAIFNDAKGRTFVEVGLKSWVPRLRRGETIARHARDFEESVRRFFELGDVKSTVAVPIFLNSHWWGFIGFDSCQGEREWLPTEIDTLKILAEMVGATVARMRDHHNLADTNVLLTTVIECSADAIVVVDQNANITTFNRNFIDLWDIPQGLVDA